MNKQGRSGRAGDQTSVPTASRVLGDGTIVELLYRPEEHRTAFAVWSDDNWTIRDQINADSERLVPFSADNNLIKHEAVLLPSTPEEYGDEARLLEDIRQFIHQHTDLSTPFETVVVCSH